MEKIEKIEHIKSFCDSLKKSDKTDSLSQFEKLDTDIKILFLQKCKEIINHENKYDEETYKIAYKICKLFKEYKHEEKGELGKLYDNIVNWNEENVDGREKPKRKIKIKLEGIGDDVAERLEQKKRRKKKESDDENEKEKEKEKKPRKKRTIEPEVGVKRTKKAKKIYDKKYQKYDEPESELDPLYLYYTSLYKERSDSLIAIKWLTEHGAFDDKKREKLISKYEGIKK